MSAQPPINFADPSAARGLVPGSKQRLVRLSFPDGTHLYSHPVALALASGVLHNVLEDTQAQQQKEGADNYITIPLDDGVGASASWQAALAFLHNREPLKVTMDSALTLLVLADKYEMPCITGPVCEFLMSTEPGSYSSRLAQHLTRQTVVGWLTAASKCGLQQAVKLCIDFIVEQLMPVDSEALSGLNRADADQLLVAVHKRSAESTQKVVACKSWLALQSGFKDTTISTYRCPSGHTCVYESRAGFAKCPRCCNQGSCAASLKLAGLERILQP